MMQELTKLKIENDHILMTTFRGLFAPLFITLLSQNANDNNRSALISGNINQIRNVGNVGIRKINYLENSNLNITFLRQLQNNLTQDRVLAFELHEYKDSNGNLNFHRLKSINEMYIDEVVFFIEKIIVPLFKDELKIPIELSTFFMELTLHAERICISINDLTTDSSFIGARCDEGKKLVATRKLYALNQTILQFECQKNTLFACMKAYAWWPSPIKVPKGILKVQEKTRAIIKLLKHTFIDSNLTAPVIQFILQSFPIMGDFPPINGVEQVQNYIDRLENSLPCNGDFELPQFKNCILFRFNHCSNI